MAGRTSGGVDDPQHHQHGAAGRRTPLPVARDRPRGRRLGPRGPDDLRLHRLARRLPRPPAEPDVQARRDPRPGRRPALHPGRRDRTALPRHHPVVGRGDPARCATLFLWCLVPFLRTRGYSALPVHYLGKAATAALLYSFPLLFLGDGDGADRHARRGVRLGVRDLGDRPLLVGRPALRLAGPQADGRPRPACARASRTADVAPENDRDPTSPEPPRPTDCRRRRRWACSTT